MAEILNQMNCFVWGFPALILIVSVGIYLSLRTGFAQVRLFPKALQLFVHHLQIRKGKNRTRSSYTSLCTALAATVGTGNLAGVAGAISIGGPGAIFWMWICAILGMITKYTEAVLAVRYRVRNNSGEWVGGPMYMIRQGIGEKWRWLAGVYSFFGVVASFGVGNATQINAVIGGINSVLTSMGKSESRAGNLIMGSILCVMITTMLLGGASRIGRTAERLVPLASILYILMSLGVLIVKLDAVPEALKSIVWGAFSPRAVTGGMFGSAFQALRVGTSRGIFTNEAGMGTAAIAHASADVSHPAEQGMMGLVEVFLDTIVICTFTALVILCSGVKIPYGSDIGITLTSQAFSIVYGNWVRIPLAICLCCFAFATVLGWGLYGARCAQYLFGDGVWKKFVILQGITVLVGALLKTGTVWMLAEMVNGLMAIPNLLALAWLSPEVARQTTAYYRILKRRKSN